MDVLTHTKDTIHNMNHMHVLYVYVDLINVTARCNTIRIVLVPYFHNLKILHCDPFPPQAPCSASHRNNTQHIDYDREQTRYRKRILGTALYLPSSYS